jgi:hypothetical protein
MPQMPQNFYYFPNQHQPAGLRNGDWTPFVREYLTSTIMQTNFRLQKVKKYRPKSDRVQLL